MLASAPIPPADDDGYRLWLRHEPLPEGRLRDAYRKIFGAVDVEGASATLRAARDELGRGLGSLLGLPGLARPSGNGPAVVAGTPDSSHTIARLALGSELARTGAEGYSIKRVTLDGRPLVVVAANHDIGVLYGAFHLLRWVAVQGDPLALDITSAPRIRHRLLNHWDNLDGSVERGYAGSSLWDWHKLPDYVSPRYTDYARANASIGVNGSVLTNVNANARVLTAAYLTKVAALAEVFRPYGIRVYLTARFSAPIEIGGLDTADPLDARVLGFWRAKVHEIYRFIPDFGGFVVKANSEGQPGPQRYERSHADGANVLAEALAPHGGIVLWRAFVYDNEVPEDRAKQAYNEFAPLDGQFKRNVLIQVKNGAIDFQPREPFHPLFGAMPNTPLALEVQLTQEYLGCATHLAYQAPLFRECLDSDTHARGEGSLVAHVADGSLHGHELSAICAVSNVGAERNWCGHPFAQANWYAFGRLAWDHRLSSDAIADEWVRLTFNNDERFVRPVKEMMLASREAVVDYMTPLGLHHLMAWDHHYGPGPWIDQGRADWTSVYFHRADALGLGFDRSPSGSDAVSQYQPSVAKLFGDAEACPERFLLWFHHVPWNKVLASGRSLWEELCARYQAGVDGVRSFQRTWQALEGMVDRARFVHVQSLLSIQEKEARWWRDACLLYFQTFSKRPFPSGSEPPERTLEEYRRIVHYYVPGTPRAV